MSRDSKQYISSEIRVFSWNKDAHPTNSNILVDKTLKSNKQKNVSFKNVSTIYCEQRCGISSCGIPDEAPSLFCGKPISQYIYNIDEYEKNKNMKKNNEYNELKPSIRIKRCKSFVISDVNKTNLQNDKKEILYYKKSRDIPVGCNCKSIFNLLKSEIINKIIKFI
eukprot:63822_1